MAHILIADDTPDSLFVLKTALETAGYTVETARDGREAVEAFTRLLAGGSGYDLVILDVAMPCLNGFDAATQILGRWPTQKIVHLTAYAEPLTVGRSLASGVLAVWTKPFEPTDLLAKVAVLLDPLIPV